MNAASIPLTHATLLEVLQAASSTSQQLVQSASTQLNNWETTDPRLWSLLQVWCPGVNMWGSVFLKL